MRVVLDTSSLLSALLFRKGHLTWLREYWTKGLFFPLVSTQTVQELIRVLAYPRFKLEKEEIELLLADYLPYTKNTKTSSLAVSILKIPLCRDKNDQMFLELAMFGEAEVLVTSDKDLLVLKNELPFSIETPAQFKKRFLI